MEVVNFWKALQKYQVKFIMVGGYAINLHGYQRYTGDMDLLLDDTIENRQRLRLAFKDYGIGDFEMMERLQFVPGWTNFHLNNGLRLDIMTELKGLEEYTFDNCLELASLAEIENVSIPFLHINHLILNKKAVNRPKDQLDVIYLEKIKKLREEGG